MVTGRWRISLLLTGLLFVLYYGYIILIATNKQLVSRAGAGIDDGGHSARGGRDRGGVGPDRLVCDLGQSPLRSGGCAPARTG